MTFYALLFEDDDECLFYTIEHEHKIDAIRSLVRSLYGKKHVKPSDAYDDICSYLETLDFIDFTFTTTHFMAVDKDGYGIFLASTKEELFEIAIIKNRAVKNIKISPKKKD